MVGYNFQAIFEPQIVSLVKRQTIRAERKRHARPGEPMQLFCEQRSRNCRKLLSPDPICTAVRRITIATSPMIDIFIASIAIDGVPLDREGIEAFAQADGFAIDQVGDWKFQRIGQRGSARWNMGAFWEERHGLGRFEGVIVTWEPS